MFKFKNFIRKYIKIAYEDIQKFGINNLICPGKPNSLDITIHLSWDYAQQIQLPYSSQQEVNNFIKFIKI